MKTFERYFTQDEENQLFKNVRKHFSCQDAQRDYYWMRILRLTGIRVTPLSKLTLGDAYTAVDTGYLKIGVHNKRGKAQSIYCVKEVRECFKKLIRLHDVFGRRTEWELAKYDRPLILSRLGRGMTVRSYQMRVKHWIESAGLEAGTPHFFRHTLAKRIMATTTADDGLRRTQAVLGHEHVSTTTIYTRPDKETLKDTMVMAS